MRATMYILAGAIVFGLAVWAYWENYATRDVYDRVEALENRIADKREELAHLRAEWSYLNRPERLIALVSQYRTQLGLTDLTAEKFGELVDLPMRIVSISTQGMANPAGNAIGSQ